MSSRSPSPRFQPAPESGFTIIELLIASVVFSMVLIVVTTGVLQFTRQYYKGVISSNTQNTARSIVDDVTRAIQFSSGGVQTLNTTSAGGSLSAGAVGYCIGSTKRYSFATNRQVTDNAPDAAVSQSRHALIADSVFGCTTSTPALNAATTGNLTTNNARELLGEHMRLSRFDVTKAPNSEDAYDVTVRVVYGDNDLLCSPSITGAGSPGGCAENAPAATATSLNGKTDVRCRSTIGNQFCAVSELHTTAQMRVE